MPAHRGHRKGQRHPNWQKVDGNYKAAALRVALRGLIAASVGHLGALAGGCPARPRPPQKGRQEAALCPCRPHAPPAWCPPPVSHRGPACLILPPHGPAWPQPRLSQTPGLGVRATGAPGPPAAPAAGTGLWSLPSWKGGGRRKPAGPRPGPGRAAQPEVGGRGSGELPLQSHSLPAAPRALCARAFYNEMPGAGRPPQPGACIPEGLLLPGEAGRTGAERSRRARPGRASGGKSGAASPSAQPHPQCRLTLGAAAGGGALQGVLISTHGGAAQRARGPHLLLRPLGPGGLPRTGSPPGSPPRPRGEARAG